MADEEIARETKRVVDGGIAMITYVGLTKPTRRLTSLRAVLYIKDMSPSLHLSTSLPLAGALSLATLLAARA
jgi:hypothetical protein